jgi:hypothetical protein
MIWLLTMEGERTYQLRVVRGKWVFSNIRFAVGHLAAHGVILQQNADGAHGHSRHEPHASSPSASRAVNEAGQSRSSVVRRAQAELAPVLSATNSSAPAADGMASGEEGSPQGNRDGGALEGEVWQYGFVGFIDDMVAWCCNKCENG